MNVLQPQTAQKTSYRLTTLDAVKFLAMLLMMQGHTLDALVSPSQLDVTQYPWSIWHMLRGFTAPIFLTLSGMLFAITTKRTEQGTVQPLVLAKRLRWAVLLMGIGYLLVFPASRFIDLFYVKADGWKFFLQVNILQLNAIALLSTTALAYFSRSQRHFALLSLIAGVLVTLATPWINSFDWFAHTPEAIGTWFSYAHGSIFPIFPFASYMFFGVAAGVLVQEVAPQHRNTYLRNKGIIAAGVLALIGVVLMNSLHHIPNFPQVDFLLSHPATVAFRLSVVASLVSIVATVQPFLRSIERPIALFGKHSLWIYVVHLIILFGTPWFPSVGRIYVKNQTLLFGALYIIPVIGGTLFTIWGTDYIHNNMHRIAKVMRYSVAAMLAYALIV